MTARLAIIGTGWGTRVQTPIFRQEGLEIVGLWARSKEKAQKRAADFGIPFHTADYQAVISHPDVDLVSITTPPHTHAEMAIAALEAGKHVLCEKPTALHTAEAKKMLDAACRHPEQIAVLDHELRFLPTQQKMGALVRDGYVGEVFHVEGTVWAGDMLDLSIPWHWFQDRESGGGWLGAVGSHFIDLMSWLLNRPIQAVNAVLRTFIEERADPESIFRAVTSDEFFTLDLKFGENITGILTGGIVTAGPPVHRLVISGSAGSLHYEDGKLTGYRATTEASEILMVEEHLDVPDKLSPTVWIRSLVHLGRALKTALEMGEYSVLAPAATFVDGLRIQHVLDAARASDKEGQWVEIG
jgi:predicted dehydrogenase|tara:strand:+ start:705 stop:1772 length:1068 start_codon:yes stop_codon:yes gene_type:complete